MRIKGKDYTTIVEKGEDVYLIGTIPEIHACHTQARNSKELKKRLREAAELCLMA
jgi:predicted RNase H-like HicB family nuclease